MSTAILQRALQHFNQGNLEGYLELYDPNATLHFLPPGMPPGLEGGRLFYGGFLAGFPDSKIELEDVITEGDKVAARFNLRATHQGDFMGIPPTGKSIVLTGITIMQFEGDKVVERWSESDFMGMMQQLGVIPAPKQA